MVTSAPIVYQVTKGATAIFIISAFVSFMQLILIIMIMIIVIIIDHHQSTPTRPMVSPPAMDPPPYCVENDVMYEPIDMIHGATSAASDCWELLRDQSSDLVSFLETWGGGCNRFFMML